MILGRVVGSVWGGKEAASLGVNKLALVSPVKFAPGKAPVEVHADGPDQELKNRVIAVVDQLGAGVGEYVLIAHGSRVRDLTIGAGLPTKDVLIAIVDSCHVDPALYQEADRTT